MSDRDWSLDDWIAEHVLNWKVIRRIGESGSNRTWFVPDEAYQRQRSGQRIYECTAEAFSTDPAADYLVLEKVRSERWIDEREDDYNKFWIALAELLRSRDAYYRDTVNQFELYYMEHYQPGDFSRAMHAAIGVKADA